MRPAPSRTAANTIEIELDGTVHRILLKRVATARRFTLRVRSTRGDIVMTLPPAGSIQAARAFALRHADWVADKLGKVAARIGFVPGNDLPVRGVPHRITLRAGLRRHVWTERGPDMALLCVSGPPRLVEAAIGHYLRSEARRDLASAVDGFAARVGRHVESLTLRDTRTRWGSCSGRGGLSFSWRLILAPPVVLDYLAAHEVAHLVHMNHSDAFWQLARTLAPTMDEAEAWLKRHGAGLHQYGT